eukprot:scaffold1175_cov107-Isochrysis_galbana.AAC.4
MADARLAEKAPTAEAVAAQRRALDQLDSGISSALSVIHQLDAVSQEPIPNNTLLREGMYDCACFPSFLHPPPPFDHRLCAPFTAW